LTEI
jgi:hypothetical protein